MARCAVPRCADPPRWHLEDENGRRWLVCGKHLDTWTAYLHNRYRAACTQPPNTLAPAKPKAQPQSTLF
jgi:hypothetical protein